MDIFSIYNWMCFTVNRIRSCYFSISHLFQFQHYWWCICAMFEDKNSWNVTMQGIFLRFVEICVGAEEKWSLSCHACSTAATDRRHNFNTNPEEESTIDDDTREWMEAFFLWISPSLTLQFQRVQEAKRGLNWKREEKSFSFSANTMFNRIIYLSFFSGGLEGRRGTALKLKSIRVRRKVSSRLKSKHRAEVEENENWCRRALWLLLMNISLRNED